MKKYSPLLCFVLSLAVSPLAAQQLSLFPTINSIGFQVTLPLGYDADSNAITTLRYRAFGHDWQPGFPATRLEGEFRGSLFQLQAATEYEVEVCVVDSFPVFQKEVLTATVETREEPIISSTANVKWVSPGGSGTDYTESSPGNLKVLLAAGLSCGTTVLLKGGDYPIGDMSLNLTQDCVEGEPIVIMATPGEVPVLDGGAYGTYTWLPVAGDTNIWWTNLPPDLEFNTLCLVDGERMYPYAFLTPPDLDPTYPSLWTMGYNLSGFYRNKFNQVFIKTLDHKNINNSAVIFSKQFSCLTVNGNNKINRLHIKGIRFKYYSKGLCSKDFLGNPIECYPSGTLTINDANQVIVDSCSFEYSNFPVFFGGTCNNNLVQNCQIRDQTGYWSHAAFKRTRDVLSWILDPSCGTYGRYLENAGIHFRPGSGQTIQGNIVRNNTIQGVVGGIGFGFDNNCFITECDIYDNKVSWCYDAIDALNNNLNTRIWGNKVHHCPVGTSLILPGYGPVYIFRNIYHHLSQRQNYQTDPFFLDCDNTETHQSWGTALKLNAGGNNLAPPGSIYFVHNTVHSTDSLGFNLYLWNPTWKTLQLRNNLFYAEGKANFFFDGVGGATRYSFESIGDNVVNAGGGALGIVRGVHGNPNVCEAHDDLQTLNDGLADATESPLVFWQNGRNEAPQFLDASSDDYHLSAASPLIDKGLPVLGFNNDFKGAAPDIGAYESADSIVVTKDFMKSAPPLQIYPNPFHDFFQVEFEMLNGGETAFLIFDLQGKLVWNRYFSYLPEGSHSPTFQALSLLPGVYFLELREPGRVKRAIVLRY